MDAEVPVVEDATIEREIAEGIAAADLRLRFDKAVVRLAVRLKAAPRVVALVHNPEADADLILTIAESRLQGRD